MSAAKRVEAEPVNLSEEQIHLIAKALADPRRLELLRQIGSCTDSVQCADIRGCHPVSAATLSHHMKELETAGLIRVTREGKFASYLLRRDVLQSYTEHLAKI
jgi:DNA-binding transcriptional ArsR family regulator